jgi:Protein of unknown function (DUF2384)
VIERVACAEADVPGRRRGDEYRQADLSAIKDDPVEQWIARVEQVPVALAATIGTKVEKRYGSCVSLLVYLNIDEFGIRQADIEAAPHLTGYCKFAEICHILRKQEPPMLAARPQSRAAEPRIDPVAALRGFFLIMDAWGASPDEARAILGAPAERTFYAWRSGTAVRVPADTLRRIGYVAGIYKALQILYADAQTADGWVKRPNRALGGQTPLQRMRAGDVTDLAAVRDYLDAARAPWS